MYKEKLKLLTKYMFYLQHFSLPLVISKGVFLFFKLQILTSTIHVCTYK